MDPQNFIPLGVITVFLGFFLIFLGSFSSSKNVEFGFGGFIGPIPFGYATDPKILKLIILISVITIVIFIILPLIKYLK